MNRYLCISQRKHAWCDVHLILTAFLRFNEYAKKAVVDRDQPLLYNLRHLRISYHTSCACLLSRRIVTFVNVVIHVHEFAFCNVFSFQLLGFNRHPQRGGRNVSNHQ